jgi:hypothetical protein
MEIPNKKMTPCVDENPITPPLDDVAHLVLARAGERCHVLCWPTIFQLKSIMDIYSL